MTSISDYFNLRKSFVFYGAYHNEWRNKLVHVFGVPSIFTTALSFASHVPMGPVTMADVAAAFYSVSFIMMEPTAGVAYAPVIGAMWYIGTKYAAKNQSVAIAVHVVAWLSQFFGHGVFEGRKPAALDNLFQSCHAAVFFVWLEVLFFFGYKPALKKELDALVKQKIADDFKTQ